MAVNDRKNTDNRREAPRERAPTPRRKPEKERAPQKEDQRRDEEGRGVPNGKGGFQWRRTSKTLALWMFVILIGVAAMKYLRSTPAEEKIISHKQYSELLETGKIERAVITDTDFHGELSEPEVDGETGEEYEFFVVNLGVVDSDTKKEWEQYGFDFRFQKKSFNWLSAFISFAPWLLFFGIWLFLLRQMQGGPKGVFSFGKSKARLLTEDKPKVTFKDVAGSNEAKQELQEIIEFLRDPKKFQRLGGRIPKGVLLVGLPGTGKTYMAKAVAGEAGVPFFSISGSDFVEMFVGVGASRVRDLFDQGKNHAPCIVFIDEIDAVGRHRGAGIGGGHDEREQTLNQLLVEMDGFESNEGVILIAATNRPDVLDPALLRPGRFDRQVVVDLPDVKGREGVLRVHTKNIPLARSVHLQVLARGTPGLSQADLANMVNEAALLASRHNRKRVAMADFEEAKDRVMMGVERKSLMISDEEKRLIAYHESGHALVAKMTPGSDPVYKVSIVARGRSLGVTQSLPMDEKHNYPQSYCEAKLASMLGGRSAEKLVFGEVSTGSEEDYKMASKLARKMVCEWGMSERLGPITYGKKEEEIFLGKELVHHRDYSEQTAIAIDEEIRAFVDKAEKKAHAIQKEQEDKLHELAQTLLDMEVLNGDQIDKVLAGEKIRRSTKRRRASQSRSGASGSSKRTRASGNKSSEGGEKQKISRRSGASGSSKRTRSPESRSSENKEEQKPAKKPVVDQVES